MNVPQPDEILGEKTSDIEDLITQMINVQNGKNEINERDAINVKLLVNTIRNNPHLMKFIQQKYMENLGLWLIQNASNILNAQYQKFKRDENGRILLDDEILLTRKHYGQGKMADKWYIINDKEFLLKNILDENIVENTLIAEEIARQLDLPVAIYFPAKEKNQEKTKVLTLNFLEFNETLIEGNKICGNEMDIIKVEEKLREFLSNQPEISKNNSDTVEYDKKTIITNYKKFILYSILINHRDAHNGNWGLIKNIETENYSYSPIYDLEGCLSENEYKIRAFNCNDKYDDESILNYILEDEEVLKLAQQLDLLDMDSVYKKIYKQKRVQIPKKLREKNINIIQEQKNLIRKEIIRKSRGNSDKLKEK